MMTKEASCLGRFSINLTCDKASMMGLIGVPVVLVAEITAVFLSFSGVMMTQEVLTMIKSALPGMRCIRRDKCVWEIPCRHNYYVFAALPLLCIYFFSFFIFSLFFFFFLSLAHIFIFWL